MKTERTATPTEAAQDAAREACDAARQARIDGADETTCALIHAETYAAAVRGER